MSNNSFKSLKYDEEYIVPVEMPQRIGKRSDRFHLIEPDFYPVYEGADGMTFDTFGTLEEAKRAVRLYNNPECVFRLGNVVHLDQTGESGSYIEFKTVEQAQKAVENINKLLPFVK